MTLRQLRAAGVSPGEVRHRLSTSRLFRIHAGVYLAGHRAPSPLAYLLAAVLAAVLACGKNAALS